MGQAKRRGNLEERIAQAYEARKRADEARREQERERRLAFERLPDAERERIQRKERDRIAVMSLLLGSLPRAFRR